MCHTRSTAAEPWTLALDPEPWTLTLDASAGGHDGDGEDSDRDALLHVARALPQPASIYDEYSICPPIRPICTRLCFTMTHVIKVYSNFH